MEEIGGLKIGSGGGSRFFRYIKYALYIWALLYVALHFSHVLR